MLNLSAAPDVNCINKKFLPCLRKCVQNVVSLDLSTPSAAYYYRCFPPTELCPFLVFSVFCCRLLSVTLMTKRQSDSCSFCFGPWQTILSCILWLIFSLGRTRDINITSVMYQGLSVWLKKKKSLNARFTCIKKSTDLSHVFPQNPSDMSRAYSPMAVCV